MIFKTFESIFSLRRGKRCREPDRGAPSSGARFLLAISSFILQQPRFVTAGMAIGDTMQYIGARCIDLPRNDASAWELSSCSAPKARDMRLNLTHHDPSATGRYRQVLEIQIK